MLDDYKSLPFIAGISILFLIPIAIGSLTYSLLTEDSDRTNPSTGLDKQNVNKPTTGRDSSAGLGGESDLRIVPIPSSGSQGGGDSIESDTSIPIGKYSNPPTNVPTGEGGISTTNRGLNLDSSVDRNQAIQERNSNSTPDYSAPSSSNNYNTPDNSLAAPLEDDSFLELPDSDSDSEPVTIPTEPLLQP